MSQNTNKSNLSYVIQKGPFQGGNFVQYVVLRVRAKTGSMAETPLGDCVELQGLVEFAVRELGPKFLRKVDFRVRVLPRQESGRALHVAGADQKGHRLR